MLFLKEIFFYFKDLVYSAVKVCYHFPMVIASAILATSLIIITLSKNELDFTYLTLTSLMGISLYFTLTVFHQKKGYQWKGKIIGNILATLFLSFIYFFVLKKVQGDFKSGNIFYIFYFNNNSSFDFLSSSFR